MKLEGFSGKTYAALQGAKDYAADLKNPTVLPAHVVVALLSDKSSAAVEAIRRLGADPSRLSRRLHDELARQRGGYTEPPWDGSTQALIAQARGIASQRGENLVRTHHLLLAATDGAWDSARRALQESGVTRTGLEYSLRDLKGLIDAEAFEPSRSNSTELPSAQTASANANFAASTNNSASSSAATASVSASSLQQFEVLSQFGRDLTELASQGLLDPLIGRQEELRRLMQVMGRRSKSNPVLIGEPGVGRGAIVLGLAQRLAEGDVPHSLSKRRIVQLDLAGLVAGTGVRGQFEERLKRLVAEVASTQGNIILYVDEIHRIAGNGRGDSSGAASVLKPALARGEITMIGTTTPADYRRTFEPDKSLERLFQTIDIRPPKVDEAVAILRGIKQRFEIHHRVQIQDTALEAAVRLADRYVIDRNLPDKAIDLIDEAASVLRLQFESEPEVIASVKNRIVALEAELVSLNGASQSRVGKHVQDELTAQRAELERLTARLEEEKGVQQRITELKAEREATTKLIERAQTEGDLGRAAELRRIVLRELEDELAREVEKSKIMHDEGMILREEVTEEDVARVVASWTGIPVNRMLESERQKLIEMEDRLGAKVIGQPQAVKAISSAVRRSRAGVQSGSRPIGNFFFVGPTGTGKTELAKALAEFLFDSDESLIRIDMSEYMEQSKVNSLIGSALGYVDSDKGGILTEAVRRRPYSVVLFDEAEKAHPDVFNLLLQVLDEGRLTDSQGRLVDFTNTIIILTSNVGAREILDLAGQVPYEVLDKRVHEILKDNFKPEFLNRLDDAVVFNALDRESLAKILAIQVRSFQRLMARQDIKVEFTPGALDRVLDVGYQPEYGARPLKRAMLTEVQDPLALLLLKGEFVAGDTIEVYREEGAEMLSFRAKTSA